MKYILWDIDGTLLLTNLAGVAALKQTIQDLYGLDNFEFTYGMAGRTDSYIVRRAIEGIKGSCTPEEISDLMQTYARILPQTLIEKNGHLLPNVKKTLEAIKAQPDITSLLLTGNGELAAHAKLAHFGIEQDFSYEASAFGEISELRDDLSKALWQKLQAMDPAVTKDDVVIMGDTPHDITCAAAVGIRCVILLAGSAYAKEKLETYQPWKILDKLPDEPKELFALLFPKEVSL